MPNRQKEVSDKHAVLEIFLCILFAMVGFSVLTLTPSEMVSSKNNKALASIKEMPTKAYMRSGP